MSDRWSNRPGGSNWGDFGPDDELGRVNWITPEKVRQGLAEVKDGLAFCLSLPLELPGGSKLNPNRRPPIIEPTVMANGNPRYNFPFSLEDPRQVDVVCDDKVSLTCQYSSQWDALSHVGQEFDGDGDGKPEIRFYNGWRGNTDIVGPVIYGTDGSAKPTNDATGARRLGVQNMAVKGMQGRAVLIDLKSQCGRKRSWVGYEELMRAMEAQGAEVEKGDMVCLYTGFADVIVEAGGNPDEEQLHNSCAVLDGRDEKLCKWIDDSGLVTLCADNYAVEGTPGKPTDKEKYPRLPLHELCLFKLGINLGELWYMRELAQHLRQNKRFRFLLTAPPLRLTGAVGSPVTPIATV